MMTSFQRTRMPIRPAPMGSEIPAGDIRHRPLKLAPLTAVAITVALLIGRPAYADEGCPDLKAQIQENAAGIVELARDNPGPAAVLAGCSGVGAMQEQSSAPALAGCVMAGCSMAATFSDCVAVASALAARIARDSALRDAFRQEGLRADACIPIVPLKMAL